jgi:hypothetical protein
MASPAVTIPAQYAKFITAVLGEAIAYVQLYGTTWHLEPALVMAGGALAVLGVPNAAKPAPAVTPVPVLPPVVETRAPLPPATGGQI